MKLAIVTAVTNPDRSSPVRSEWPVRASEAVDIYTVMNGMPTGIPHQWSQLGPAVGGRRMHYHSPEILGVVPAYAIGVAKALADGAELIACLHDDVEIYEYGWDTVVREHFYRHPACGLVGFGGGVGLGAANIYQTPYDPMQLARQDFVSNMRDAEAHGRRVQVPMRVACLDGFSQIGRREFWRGYRRTPPIGIPEWDNTDYSKTEYLGVPRTYPNLFQQFQDWGIVHHCYDSLLGCFAKRLDWQVWMLPIVCHHLGGQTAVGDKSYQEWANAHQVVRDRRGHMATGDQGFWLKAHEIGYAQFSDVLPIRVEQP